MSAAGHTPGPWSYDGDGFESAAAADTGTDGYTVFSVDAEGQLVENICNIDDAGDDLISEANARLIAAAPELLEALRNTRAALAYALSEMSDAEPLYQKVIATEKHAAETITKAGGEVSMLKIVKIEDGAA